jgi:hypothetical protein
VIFGSQEKQIMALSEQLQETKDSLKIVATVLEDTSYFTLQENENAIEYIERLGLEAEDVEKMIRDKIYDSNGKKGGNPIIPLKGLKGDFKINKISFVNHRWILADFSDGTNWGELIIEYFFDENNQLELTTMSSVLYSGS